MATHLDVYAAVHKSHGANAVTEARIAARKLDTNNGVAALVSSVFANIR